MNEIKRHFYNGKEYIVDEENKRIIISKDFLNKLSEKKLWGKFGFKKIGGSSIGDVLGASNFSSLFSAFCRIMWIGLPILDRKYVDAGIAIEPKVLDAIRELTGKEVIGFEPSQYNYDYFAGKDEIIGGIPDGFIPSDKLLLEIKTTGEKNIDKWNTYGVPTNYQMQGQLYAYLMGVDKFSIVATFLKEEDYLNPDNYPIKKRKMKNWNYTVNISQVEDHIKKAKDFYREYTSSGISPSWSESLDKDLLEWLRCKDEFEFELLLDKWERSGKYIK